MKKNWWYDKDGKLSNKARGRSIRLVFNDIPPCTSKEYAQMMGYLLSIDLMRRQLRKIWTEWREMQEMRTKIDCRKWLKFEHRNLLL